MATDERFILVPYAGVSPTGTLINEIGIPGDGGASKIAAGIPNSNSIAVPLYFCLVSGYTNGIYFHQYDSANPNNLVYAYWYRNGSTSSSVPNGIVTVGRADVRYINPGTSNLKADGNLTAFNSLREAAEAFMNMIPDNYVNLQYIGNGCSVNGFSYVEAGVGVLAYVTLPIGTTLSAGNISVTKNGSPINFNYNPQTQQIAFTAI